MKKAGLTLAALLAGCSLQNAPEVRHTAPTQPSAAQPAAFSPQPENYALIRCDYTLTMDMWGYSIECKDDFTKIHLDHYEWAPESVVYDGECDERLFLETAYGKAKYIDYGCNGINAFIGWTLMQREGYDIFAPDTINSPATESNDSWFKFLKEAIGAGQADAAWRFRHRVQPRQEGGN